MSKVVIIIPTYNEADCIESTLLGLQQVFSHIPQHDMHILIFDSSSTDNTQPIIKRLQQQCPNIHLATEPVKSGLGSAYIKAMHHAIENMQADVVFEFDADGSHQPKYLPGMIKALDEGADVVVGSRYVPGGQTDVGWPWYRKLISQLGNIVARTLLTRKYKDMTSGFRGTKVEYLKKVNIDKLLSKNYAYKIHLFWALHKVGAKIVEFPIEFIDRQQGYSKFPKNNATESLKVVFLLRLYEMRRYFAMGLIGILGMVVQLIAFNLLRHVWQPEYANIVGIELAIISNFILNNRISFHDRRLRRHHPLRSWFKKLLQFNLLSLGAMAIQTLVLTIGLDVFGYGVWEENLFVFVGIVLGSVYNYVVYSKFVWKKPIDFNGAS
ncbi:MAG: glycosyltransferase family 2 protein [Coxiellaceae bacterium]|nr:glycosyltransferase family 2 protein [Coxiellaceae bacterium]